MKFKVVRSRMFDGLKKLQNVANARGENEIFANVKIEAKDKAVELTSTNGIVTIRTSVECAVSDPGVTTVSAKLLISLVGSLPEGEISVSSNSKAMTVQEGSSKYRLAEKPADLFPNIQEIKKPNGEYVLPVQSLREMLNKTAYAQSTDDTRKNLKCVLFDFRKEKLRCVATDGRRLALSELALPEKNATPFQFQLPTDAVATLQKVLGTDGNAKIRYSTDSQVSIEIGEGETTVYSRIVAEGYPNYEQVIPKSHVAEAVVSRQELIDAVTRSTIMSSTENYSITLVFEDGRLIMKVVGLDGNDAHEEIAIKFQGEKIETIFNPRFLLDAVRGLTNDEIIFEFTDGTTQSVLRSASENYLGVLMPLRLNA